MSQSDAHDNITMAGGGENASTRGKKKEKGEKKKPITTGMNATNTAVQYSIMSEQLKGLNQHNPHLIKVNRSQLQNIPPNANVLQSSYTSTLNDYVKNQQMVPKSKSLILTGNSIGT